MVIWGGRSKEDGSTYTDTATGGIYDSAGHAWTATSTVGAPTPRVRPRGFWTGNEMLIWGGEVWHDTEPAERLYDGALYDPVLDSWRPVSNGGPKSGSNATAAWADQRMMVWTGEDGGWMFEPKSNTWRRMNPDGAPSIWGNAAIAWAGTELILWGATGDGSTTAGARYRPPPQD